MKKRIFFTEAAYALGLIMLALGAALCEKADFGMSVIVAPAYLLHLKLSELLPFFSFGMAEYTLQAMLLAVLCLLLRRVRVSYFYSFLTALLYGMLLDGIMALMALLPVHSLWLRAACYVSGITLGAGGVALLFRTYLPPEAYELFVKELSAHYHIDIHAFKTAYDCASCIASVVLSFAFFGLWHFEGIKWGTIVCALVNGPLISLCDKALDAHFHFRDCPSLRRYFD